MTAATYGVYSRNFSLIGNYTSDYGNDTDVSGAWNVSGVSNVTRDAQTDLPVSWRLAHRASSYAFVITMLSITVVMATMFTLFGLFMKAEAHKSSEDHHGGNGSGGGGGPSMFHVDITGNDDNFMKSIDMDVE